MNPTDFELLHASGHCTGCGQYAVLQRFDPLDDQLNLLCPECFSAACSACELLPEVDA